MNAARQSGVGILIAAPDAAGTLRRIFVNEAAAEILGYTVDELMAQPALFNLAPGGMAAIQAVKERRSRGEQATEPFHISCIRKDGVPLILQCAFCSTLIAGVQA